MNKLKKQAPDNPQTAVFLEAVLEEVAPFEQSRQKKYENFLAKFPNGKKYRVAAGKLWYDLYGDDNAPLADDVSGESNPVEFLRKWQKEHAKE